MTVPENESSKKVEDMDLHRVEALLYTFHKLGKQCPDFLSKDPERQKEFKKKCVLKIKNKCTLHNILHCIIYIFYFFFF